MNIHLHECQKNGLPFPFQLTERRNEQQDLHAILDEVSDDFMPDGRE